MNEVLRTRDDGAIPAARYTDPGFADLELDRLWKRVWQVACREEELALPGDFTEYAIGHESVLIVRQHDNGLRAMHNSCRHRGSKIAEGSGTMGDCLRCPYHGWRYSLDGRVIEVVDRADFGATLPDDLRLAEVAVATYGGFVFVNLDPAAMPLETFLGPIPGLLDKYRLADLRLRLARTTVLPANWKVVVDAFNEGYHVQGLHPQILPWTDDTSIAYEQFETHARYGRLPGARRVLQPSPRLGLGPRDYDEGEILAGMVGGLGGAFLRDERELVAELRSSGPPQGQTLLAAFQSRRRALMEARGFDAGGFDDDELTSAQDIFWFPNLVGPIYPGSALLFRVRPHPDDVHSSLNDTWVLEWPDARAAARPARRETVADWTAFEWDAVTRQDYENIARVQRGMRSSACTVLRPNPEQESNVLHMHRVIDRYLF